MRGNAVLIRVSAPPVENAANDALIDFLSGALKVPRRSLKIIAGERSRDKRVAITGIDDATAMKALGLPPS
jgi:uncharacterized protein YggU (UPF0235/DUF167 family)